MSDSFTIPSSTALVDVKAIDGGHLVPPSFIFWKPVLPGHETFQGITYSFLLENKTKGKRVLFDLGLRKDSEGWSPAIQELAKAFGLSVDKDVPTQLTEGGVHLDSVDAVIWSHFDHIGDMSLFPLSTELVVGQGTKSRFLPPYPDNPESPLHETDFKGRKVTEISFDDSKLSIGGFRAVDYFEDGSLYILDVPGHITGHVNALARVTPTTFVLLGGDTCHHPGMMRPNVNISRYFPCPGSLLSDSVSHEHFAVDGKIPEDRPLLEIGPTYEDVEVAKQSIKTLSETFDAHPDVFVILAHDGSLLETIDMFPKSLNAWKEKGWKEKVMWAFLEEKNIANVFKPVL